MTTQTVEGTIVGSGGDGQEMKAVEFRSDGEQRGSALTGMDGTFEIELDDGDSESPPRGSLVVRDPAQGGEEIASTSVSGDDWDSNGTVRTKVRVEAAEPVSHGQLEHRGLSPEALDGDKAEVGRFVRGFPDLPAYRPSDEFLQELGQEGGPLHEPSDTERGESSVPAGFPLFAQFIDHEITLDLTSSLKAERDPVGQKNFRTPRLDLDSMYGDGEEGSAFLYDQERDGKLLLHEPDFDVIDGDDPPDGLYDLNRTRQGRAITIDPRNDENEPLSQLLVAFLRFHNHVVDYITTGPGADETFELVADEDTEDDEETSESGESGKSGSAEREDVFETAQRLVRYHYQWAIRYDFLPTVCDKSVLEEIETDGRRHFLQSDPAAIPVEFAVAAYRYGHSRIRTAYRMNEDSGEIRLFPDMHPAEGSNGSMEETLRGFTVVEPDHVADWSLFFDYGATETQSARKIDPKLADPLFELPFVGPEGLQSLATRNLLRGSKLGLPAGQRLASAMGYDPIPNETLQTADGSYDEVLRRNRRGVEDEAPAWYYILAEAELQNDGERLGAVGSRIVGEVIDGLLDLDETSVFSRAPHDWEPVLPNLTDGDHYRIADVLKFATGPTPDGLGIAAVESGAATDGPERVTLEHTGNAELDLDGYTISFGDGERVTFGSDGVESPSLAPEETLHVYPGEAPDNSTGLSLGIHGDTPVLADEGDTVRVRTPTRELSARHEF